MDVGFAHASKIFGWIYSQSFSRASRISVRKGMFWTKNYLSLYLGEKHMLNIICIGNWHISEIVLKLIDDGTWKAKSIVIYDTRLKDIVLKLIDDGTWNWLLSCCLLVFNLLNCTIALILFGDYFSIIWYISLQWIYLN